MAYLQRVEAALAMSTRIGETFDSIVTGFGLAFERGAFVVNFFREMFTEEKLALAVSRKKVLGAILERHHARTLILEYPNSVKDFAHPVTWCIGSA